MKKINIFYKNIDNHESNIEEKQKALNSNDIFDKLKDKDKQDKELFTKLFDNYYNQLSEKNKELFQQINQNKFFEWKQTTEFVLSTLLFLDENWERKNKQVKLFLKKKPVLVHKIINWFTDEAKTILEKEKKEQEATKKEQEATKKEQEATKKEQEKKQHMKQWKEKENKLEEKENKLEEKENKLEEKENKLEEKERKKDILKKKIKKKINNWIKR